MAADRADLAREPALRDAAGLLPRLPGADAAARAAAARELLDEPALAGGGRDGAGTAWDEDPHGVWGEPALAASRDASASRARHAAWVAAQWEGAGAGRRALVFLALALAAGPFALLCATVREAVALNSILAVAVLGPIAEELGKIAAPLMTLEKRPWLFSSGGSLAALCALSGLVFASVENLVYFFFYIRDPTPGIVLWRLTVCTALHVGCSTLSGLGLARAWRRAARDRAPADPSLAATWTIAAIVVHGSYNALAAAWTLFARAEGG